MLPKELAKKQTALRSQSESYLQVCLYSKSMFLNVDKMFCALQSTAYPTPGRCCSLNFIPLKFIRRIPNRL